MWRAAFTSVLSLWFVSLGLPAAQTDGSGADLELLKRLFSTPGVETQLVEVVLGRLPGVWPSDIPIPEGTEIIGGLVFSDGSISVRYSLAQTPEEVCAFYTGALGEAGWTPLERSLSGEAVGFCREQEQLVVLAAREGSVTEVLLSYSPTGFLCPPREDELGLRILPHLLHKASVVASGSSGGLDWESVRLELVSGESAAELAAFYRGQFLAAGWELVDHGEGDAAAWSRFRKRDELGEWEALLFVIESLREREHILFVRGGRLGY